MGALFLLVTLIYLIAAIIVIVKAKGWKVKLLWALGFVLLPTYDILLAQAYMYYRCSQDGGVRVYERIFLEKSEIVQISDKDFKREHWGREISIPGAEPERVRGESGYFEPNPKFRHWLLPERYYLTDKDEDLLFGVKRGYRAYIDQTRQKVIGERVVYGHKSSWYISLFYGPEAFGWGCPDSKKVHISDFDDSIFDIRTD